MKYIITFLLVLFTISSNSQSYFKDSLGYKRIRGVFNQVDTVWVDTLTDQVTMRFYVGKNLYDNSIVNDTLWVRVHKQQYIRFLYPKNNGEKLITFRSTHYWIVRRSSEFIENKPLYIVSGAF